MLSSSSSPPSTSSQNGNKITDYFIKKAPVCSQKQEHSSSKSEPNKITNYFSLSNDLNILKKHDKKPKLETILSTDSDDTIIIDQPIEEKNFKRKRKSRSKPKIKRGLKENDQNVEMKQKPRRNKKSKVAKTDSSSELSLWTNKYRPKNIESFNFCDSISDPIKTFDHWLKTWKTRFDPKFCDHTNGESSDSDGDDDDDDINSVGKCFYIYGPSGVGKTCAVYVLADENRLNILEYNVSIKKLTTKSIREDIFESSQSRLITEQKPGGYSKSLILLDDLDAIIYENKSLNDLSNAIKFLIRKSRRPIVITSKYNPIFLFEETFCFEIVEFHISNHLGFRLANCKLNSIIHSEYPTLEKPEIDFSNSKNIFGCLQFEDLRKFINYCNFWLRESPTSTIFSLDSICKYLKNLQSNIDKHSEDLNHYLNVLNIISYDDVYRKNCDKLLMDSVLPSCTSDSRYDCYLEDKRFSLVDDIPLTSTTESMIPDNTRSLSLKMFEPNLMELYLKSNDLGCLKDQIDGTIKFIVTKQDKLFPISLTRTSIFDYIIAVKQLLDSSKYSYDLNQPKFDDCGNVRLNRRCTRSSRNIVL